MTVHGMGMYIYVQDFYNDSPGWMGNHMMDGLYTVEMLLEAVPTFSHDNALLQRKTKNDVFFQPDDRVYLYQPIRYHKGHHNSAINLTHLKFVVVAQHLLTP